MQLLSHKFNNILWPEALEFCLFYLLLPKANVFEGVFGWSPLHRGCDTAKCSGLSYYPLLLSPTLQTDLAGGKWKGMQSQVSE